MKYSESKISQCILPLRKGVLKNSIKFTGKHLCWSPFYEVASLQPLQHKCFAVKFAKLLRVSILRNICKRLLLEAFYKKAALKNFATFTGRKKPVISIL